MCPGSGIFGEWEGDATTSLYAEEHNLWWGLCGQGSGEWMKGLMNLKSLMKGFVRGGTKALAVMHTVTFCTAYKTST
jgi:hypothetical protein